MRDHDHHGSGQVGAERVDAGQTGHETGHGSFRRRLRRVLSDGLKGLACGVFADEIDRLTVQRETCRAERDEAREAVKRMHLSRAGLVAELISLQFKVRLADECASAIVDRLKAENDDLKRTNANLREAYEREHKEAAALRRRLAGPATMETAGDEGAKPDAWCGRCDTPLGRRPTQGEVDVTCSGCGAVVTLTPPHDPTGEG